MRREKRIALLLLSVSLLLFAGCGQKKSKEAINSAVPGTESVSEESAATGTAAEAEAALRVTEEKQRLFLQKMPI